MKLLICVIRDIDDPALTDRLTERGFRFTRIASTGGFLRKGNVTLLIGIPEDKLEEIVEIFRRTCCPAESGQNRAILFVVDSPVFEQI
ncbi:MAG: cyclic-di-AMP receptor [Anaerolineales bacterium]|nr:cyclic-di-AMP receptor [Anaerolineales bacterium]